MKKLELKITCFIHTLMIRHLNLVHIEFLWHFDKYFPHNHKLIMFMRRVLRFAMATQNTPAPKLPKAPTLLSGELENYRFGAEHTRIYDGYTLDELYGSKIGVKHSPAVRAEMRKYLVSDTGTR
jgi:hypothetical protein